MSTYNYSSTAGEYTLTSDITSSATSVSLNSVTGLPAVPFKVVIDPGLAGQEEIVKVTAVAGTTLTVVRGWDSSVAVAHTGLAKVRHMATAEDFRLSRDHEAATTAHGVAGVVVGTTDTQTLTNKTLNAPVLTGTTTAGPINSTGALSATGAVSAAGVTSAAGSVTTGDSASATEQRFKAQRLGTDATSKSIDMFVDASDRGVVSLYSNGALVNSLYLDKTGATSTSGNFTAPNLATLTGAETLSNKTLATPTLTGTTTAGAITSSGAITGTNLIETGTKAGKKIHWGVYSLTTAADGTATITHGAGFTPSGGACTVITPLGSVVATYLRNFTSTQADLGFYYVSTGNQAVSLGITVFIIWGE